MNKSIPVYQVELTLGTETVNILSTDIPMIMEYGDYVIDYDAKPIGYLIEENK